MYSDCALLLQTVLSERGCMDETLQDTVHTVPFVYRVIAEHTFYAIYGVSVVKALLHEKDGAFAHLARWQATRSAPSHSTSTTSATAQEFPLTAVPPLAPCDALDMSITILGGGTCCELLLRLLLDGEAHRTTTSPGHLLVHPSHITVVTRQPARLARHAQRGVHCLRRHHGRSAVMQSDVVLLTCPPALFREVAHDLHSAPATTAEVGAATVAAEGASARRAPPRGASGTAQSSSSSTSAANSSSTTPSLLQPNAVLLSCMAGVPARRVAMTFQRTPELTLVTRITSQDGVLDDTAVADGSSPVDVGGEDEAHGVEHDPLPTRGSLQQVALHYKDVFKDYTATRMDDMRCHISFLRPAVLQQQRIASAARAAASTAHRTTTSDATGRVVWTSGEDAVPASIRSAAAPRRTDFTAGRQRATAPSLIAFLDLWRLLRAYVKATFTEALRKARTRVRAAGGNTSSGLISVVLPSSPHGPVQVPGEVEAELLPALALLPASKTLTVWRAWWRTGFSGSTNTPPPPPLPPSLLAPRDVSAEAQSRSGGVAGGYNASATTASSLSSLSPQVTAVTGSWLSHMYASDDAFLEDLELQYQHVLEGQLMRAS